MENKLLDSFLFGWFFIIGIAILLGSLLFPKTEEVVDPGATAAGPSFFQELALGIESFLQEVKSSSDTNSTSNSSPPSNEPQEDPSDIFNRAYEAYGKGEYQNAVDEYSKYLEKVPNDTSGHYNRGLALYSLDNYSEALTDFEKATELDPKKAVAFLYKGYCHERLDNCMQSIEDFQTAIDLGYNRDAELFKFKARCENREEDFSEGLKDALKAVALDKKDSYNFFEVAFAQYGLKKYSESAATYSKVLQMNPKDDVALHNRGLAYVFMKKTSLACKDFQKSLDLGYEDSKERLKEYCK
ncbi:tetratricopeptide repeat protein [Leptospira sp. 201903071]|uniref:tetratricopeptide repeat protein n=1 Tax=Leptospira ainazelensis TaxID=2810034 RepID=UPI001964B1E0|nr:tetratricopeptide repeat protein [Leptospira ainazelensis]MBM9502340.1 tetratricopeptide repeat protein [Leptospira ainazelensis]